MKQRTKLVLAAVAMVAALTICAASIVTSLASKRRIEAAIAYAAKLESLIRNDSRFTNVNACGLTAAPQIIVIGTVKTPEESDALYGLVVSSQPPVPVVGDIHIGVVPTNRTWPTVEWKIDPENKFPWIKVRTKKDIKHNYERISVGMSRYEVESLLGLPCTIGTNRDHSVNATYGPPITKRDSGIIAFGTFAVRYRNDEVVSKEYYGKL